MKEWLASDLQEKRKAKEEADVARREAEDAERARAEELKQSQDEQEQADCRSASPAGHSCLLPDLHLAC